MSTPVPNARRYRLLDVLGKGGFGTVYRADLLGPSGFTRPVAIKMLHPEVERDARLVARLRDEARILSLLRHRAIVQVDGLVQLAGRQAIVMEFVPGWSAAEWIRRDGPLPRAAALEVTEEVASALATAWDTPGPDGQPIRLLHRDVKPANVQLTPEGTVKLLDFGVARASFAERESTSQAVLFGSLGYLAPERLRAIDDAAGDVFSLGATLAELLGAPLPGIATDDPHRHQERVEAALRALPPTTPSALQQLLRSLLSWGPSERPTARAVAAQCRALRASADGADLATWCAQRAAGVTPAPPSADDLSGCVLFEEAAAPARAAPTTFDDLDPVAPTGEPERPLTPLPLAAPPSELPEPPIPVPAPSAPAPSAPAESVATANAPASRSPSRGWWRAFAGLGLLVLTGGAVAVALLAGGALVGVGLLSWMLAPMVDEAVIANCIEEVDQVSADIAASAPTAGREAALAELRARGGKTCREGHVSLLEVAMLGSQVERSLSDGALSDAEAQSLISWWQAQSR
jgi:serine/threonine protein kinase